MEEETAEGRFVALKAEDRGVEETEERVRGDDPDAVLLATE